MIRKRKVFIPFYFNCLMIERLLEQVIESIGGKAGMEVVNYIKDKKNVNEFLIAKKIKLAINQTRNVLYKLAESGLIAFTRKKDKRKGWYTYFWTFNLLKGYEIVEKTLLHKIDNLQKQLKHRETDRYYYCKNCHAELNEETALLHNFLCLECGEVYTVSESEKIVLELRNKIGKMQEELTTVKKLLSEMRQSRAIRNVTREKRILKKKKKQRQEIRKAQVKKMERMQKKMKKKKR